MSSAHYRPADLGPEQLKELKSLEQEMGKVVVALRPEDSLAELDDAQLARLRDVESRLGVVLVAYADGAP